MTALTHFHEAAALHEMLPFSCFVDESGVFVTKAGCVAMAVSVSECDTECLAEDGVMDVANVIESAFRSFDERFRIYQYQFKRRIDAELFTVKTVLVAMLEVTSRGPLFVLSGQSYSQSLEASMNERVRTLRAQVELFRSQIAKIASVSVLSQTATFEFLSELVNYDEFRREAVVMTSSHLDWAVLGSEVAWHRNGLVIGDTHAVALTLKASVPEIALPEFTAPNYLAGLLAAPAESIIVTEWKPLNQTDARRVLEKAADHQHDNRFAVSFMGTMVDFLFSMIRPPSAPEKPREDVIAVESGTEISGALKDVGMKGMAVGEFAMSVFALGRSQEESSNAAARLISAAQAAGVTLYREQTAAQLVWLAALPGNAQYQCRTMKLSERVYGDLSLLYSPREGQRWNDHLNAQPIGEFDTRQGTRYSLNLHVHDVGNTLVLGSVGSGKTHLLKHLARNSYLRYNPRIITFDLKDSFREMIEEFGGAYVKVGDRDGVRINPFSLEPEQANIAFLHSLARVLLEHNGYKLTTGEESDLYQQIYAVYDLPVGMRRLGSLSLSRALQPRLERWIGDGQFGWMFDNELDTLSGARWQGYGFGELDHDAIEPVLFYILHRASMKLSWQDRTFTMFLIDEAWTFFRNETARNYIRTALKTWREKNAAVILATQSVADMESTRMLEVVAESVASKILLPNHGADRDWYAKVLGLNAAEIGHVLNMQRQREFLLCQDGVGKVLQLNERGND